MQSATGPFSTWLVNGETSSPFGAGNSENETIHEADQEEGVLDEIVARLAPLDLSDDQQTMLEELIAHENPKVTSLVKTLRKAEKALLKHKGPAEEAAIEVGVAARNMAIEVASLQESVSEILTPGQRAKLASVKLQQFFRKLLMGGKPAYSISGRA